MANLETSFAGITFKNPITLASGTCGFGRELNEYFDIQKLGGICSKGLTLHAHGGNDGIRIWETPSGIMNSVGMENPGVEQYIEKELPWIREKDLVNIVNIGGHCLEDYVEGVSLLNNEKIDIIELNISCPNVKNGGMNFGVKTEAAREVVKAVRAATNHKLVIKLSPNAEDIVGLAKMCEEEGADGVSLTNTFLALAIDINKKKAVFNNGYAGLSGSAIKPISLRMTHQVANAVKIPVIGIGGITTWEDVVEYIMVGASLVQLGTGSFMHPTKAMNLIDGLEQYMEENGIKSLEEIRGII